MKFHDYIKGFIACCESDEISLVGFGFSLITGSKTRQYMDIQVCENEIKHHIETIDSDIVGFWLIINNKILHIEV